jgi:hypothetical protein
MTPSKPGACFWCGKGFEPRHDGGKKQRFCCSGCRRAFDAAGRRFVAEAIAARMLTVDALRRGTRALLSPAISGPPVPEPRRSASKPVSLPPRPDEAAELLYALLAVQSEGWHALATAMSDELFDRLKRWHAPRLAKNWQ